jgi:hypothetical protein
MNGNPANGNRLQLWDCNTPTPASQHFMIVSDRILWRQKCLQVDQAVIGSPTGAAVQVPLATSSLEYHRVQFRRAT